MANQWLRLWHDMPNDPKWRTISRISGVSVSIVQSVWIQILVSASQNEERGVFSILDEDIASALNEDEESVAAVIHAMQGRVLDGKKLTGWEQRQPSREDGSAGGGKSPSSNYVYYVADTDRDVVKVGISRNPWARVKDIQVGSSSKIELIATMKTNARSERAIHSLFQKTRLEGEWFMRSEAINLLISKTLSKEVDSIESAINYLSSLPEELFLPTVDGVVSVVTTKDKEEIKRREDLKDKPHSSAGAREAAPPCPAAANPIIDNRPPPLGGMGADGKFTMYQSWRPDDDFLLKAAQWGTVMTEPPPETELAEFVTYWQAEGKAFHHVQWEQKFAQSLKRNQFRKPTGVKRNENNIRADGYSGPWRGDALEQSISAMAEQLRAAGHSESEIHHLLGGNGGNIFGQVASQERDSSVITLEPGDYSADR